MGHEAGEDPVARLAAPSRTVILAEVQDECPDAGPPGEPAVELGYDVGAGAGVEAHHRDTASMVSTRSGGGSKGERSDAAMLRVSDAPRSTPPGPLSASWTGVPRSPTSIAATARSQRVAAVEPGIPGSTESRIQVAARTPWTETISKPRLGRAIRSSSFSA